LGHSSLGSGKLHALILYTPPCNTANMTLAALNRNPTLTIYFKLAKTLNVTALVKFFVESLSQLK